MNRTELVKALVSRTNVSIKDVDTVLRSLEDVVTETVATGDEKVIIPGFVTFERIHRAARTGTNPKTSEHITIPAHYAVKTSAGTRIKRAVRG